LSLAVDLFDFKNEKHDLCQSSLLFFTDENQVVASKPEGLSIAAVKFFDSSLKLCLSMLKLCVRQLQQTF
jgi:hypothetical protein